MKRVGICFSRDFIGNKPLDNIGKKLPVYLRLLELCQRENWEVYVLTRKTYKGNGTFKGSWLLENKKFIPITPPIRIDLVYDKTGGLIFPPDENTKMIVVDRRDFKILCWDKWAAYKKTGKYMPKTFWIGGKKNLVKVLTKVATDWVVLKPYNGLKGVGIFIGPKSEAKNFQFIGKNPKYIAQEFVDTRGGIARITNGLHDLRVAIVNGKAVWSHVRVPGEGKFMANAAQGGILTEVDYSKVPEKIKKIVNKIAKEFYQNYDNPIYSIDFGIGNDGVPKIFELNDQIGFPLWEMKARDAFLNELVKNFESKLK